MFKYSRRSTDNLIVCHVSLRVLFEKVLEHWDHTILVGRRGKEAQNEAFETGRSKLRFPNSKHNKVPSLAVDVAPYPIAWDDIDRFRTFGGFVLGVAKMMGIDIRWGGDWDGDWDLKDQKLIDLPHFELR